MAGKKKAPATPKGRKKTPSKKPDPKRPSRLWRFTRFVLLLAVVGGIAGAAGLAGVFEFYGRDLPEIFDRQDYKPRQITRIYSSDGQLIEELVAPDGRRTVVAFDEIAPPMRDAILAAEDADFYRHKGLDYIGMVRALYYALRYDRIQGASTITQQVVKNLILTPERTIKRKVQEAMLARQLEGHLSKDDILYIYLNQIYYGHGNYGVEEAARYFFGKPASTLTLPEAATLAGIVQSPERYSPFKHPERAIHRRRYVLEQLWKKGFIGEGEAQAAMKAPLKLTSAKERSPHLDTAPYYTTHVQRLLSQRFPDQEIAAMGLRITTALDLTLQASTEASLREGLRAQDARSGRYRPLRRLKKSKQIEDLRAEGRRKAARGLKTDLVYQALVVGVTAKAIEVAVGDVVGPVAVTLPDRVNPDGKPLTAVFAKGDVLAVMVSAAVPRGTREASFLFAPGAQSGAVVIDVATRHVEALVGGYDFKDSNFNRATQARRQTGSAFKPVVYGAALADKISTPAMIWLDAPKPFALPGGEVWSPKNSDGRFKGPLTMRKALAKSRNVVAVRLLEAVTIPRAQAFARAMGFESSLVDNYTMALGSSELTVLETTAAFAALPDGGRRAAPIFIVSIHDSYGQPIFQNTADKQPGVAPDVAWLLTDMMTSVVTEGTAARIGKQFGRPAAGKTGTTNKNRDAWFIGFTPHKVSGVWVGNDDNTSLGKGSTGGKAAAPIWLGAMKAAHKGLPKTDFEKPAIGVVDAFIDPRSGLLATEDHKPRRKEFFLAGTAPTQYAPEEGETTAGDFLLGQGGEDEDEDGEDDVEAPGD